MTFLCETGCEDKLDWTRSDTSLLLQASNFVKWYESVDLGSSGK
jgi:hypothetical protein